MKFALTTILAFACQPSVVNAFTQKCTPSTLNMGFSSDSRYLTQLMVATDPTTSTSTRTGSTESIVPFGGSAPVVKNPDKSILGGKGVGLQEMSKIGISVPPGFTLTTPLCQVYEELDDLPEEIWEGMKGAIEQVEKDLGDREFGNALHPLLFSCRSGAAVSMPGMMDTVLNVVSTRTKIFHSSL